MNTINYNYENIEICNFNNEYELVEKIITASSDKEDGLIKLYATFEIIDYVSTELINRDFNIGYYDFNPNEKYSDEIILIISSNKEVSIRSEIEANRDTSMNLCISIVFILQNLVSETKLVNMLNNNNRIFLFNFYDIEDYDSES